MFSENFVAIHEIKPVLTLNNPIYVGFSILYLNDYYMYDFHHKYVERKHDARLLFTDTDSLVYGIETENVYEDFYQDKYLFDLSNYPKHLKFLILIMKKLLVK